MKWFKESKKRDIVGWEYQLIPYTNPKSFDVKFYTNLSELFAFYGIEKEEGVWSSTYEDAINIIDDAMRRIQTMIKSNYPKYEVTINTTAFPDVWIIISGIPDMLAVNSAVEEVIDILKSFTAIITSPLKKVSKRYK